VNPAFDAKSLAYASRLICEADALIVAAGAFTATGCM